MTRAVHRHFVKTAAAVSPPLQAAFTRIGWITWPERRRRGLPYFLCRAVVGQQLSVTAARSIWARIETAMRANGGSVPEFFCARNARVLRRCGMSNAKIKALAAIRAAHAAGLLSVRRLRRMGHAERSAHLQQVWGIGQWTADMTSIFYFRDPDVWPEGDVGVYRGLEMVIGRRSRRTVLRIAKAFSPYRSFLALYMWRVLDNPKGAGKQPLSNRKQPV